MKKIFLIFSLCLTFFVYSNVKACGEIKSLTSNVGTVTQTNSTNYLISIPEGTNKVLLNASTDYDWVNGYGPREVSTNTKVELKVDGNKCGYGIYTYFISFKHISNLIAESTETNLDSETPNIEENTENNNTNDEENNSLNQEESIQVEEEILVKLSTLTIENYELVFEPNKTLYELEVESNEGALNIIATPENELDTVVISDNAKNLQTGENEITITVTNQAGLSSIYKIKVNKAETLSSNNFLGSITINGYALNFDSSQTNYNLEIGNEKTIIINAVTENKKATYEVLGNNNLKNKSIITIRVTAEDGSIRDYVINITKTFNIKDYLIYIVIVVLIILLIILLIINKKRKAKTVDNSPSEIGNIAETAGVKTEIIPENISSNNEQIFNTEMSTNIEYIQPTNVVNETPNAENAISILEEQSSDTEIFKL